MLDIGAWDGFYTFEMERRGAHVVALDLFRNEKFLLARELQKSKAEYVVGDICKLSSKDLGRFDIVLFFGVLYHVKHPVMALENVCSMTLDTAYVESYVIDDPANLDAVPILEFYEHTELRGQFDNWCGPNVACLMAMARTAGFAEVEGQTLKITGVIASPDGRELVRDRLEGNTREAVALGENLARTLLSHGGREILRHCR